MCGTCGAKLPEDASEGQCPQCMMKAALEPGTKLTDAAGPLDNRIPAPQELAPLFPSLDVLEFLGRGGMGLVYRARQTDLDRDVALKILTPSPEQASDFSERFNREAKVLAKLNHPNIVTVYDFGRTESGLCYLLMEFVDGPNLRGIVQVGDLQPTDALAIVPQICDALQYAHELGVVHRDIKPENILLNREGHVKIADFGIAKLLGKETEVPVLTRSQQVMGTPRYMAPEQIQSPGNVDHRADIYSLGVVFYEMLTGEPPMGRFPPPSRKVQMDVRLDDIVLRALDREPDRRYQHAAEVKTAIETIQHDGPRGGAPTPPPVATETPPTPPGGKNYALLIMGCLLVAPVGILCLVCLAGIAIGFYRHLSFENESATLAASPPLVSVDGALDSGDWGGNLLLNAGFEEAANTSGTEAAYWVSAPTTMVQEAPADCQRVTGNASHGDACLKITKRHSEHHGAEAGFMQNLTQLPPGERILVSGLIRTTNVNGSASIKLRLSDTDGAYRGMCTTPQVKGTTSWRRHAATVTVPPGAIGVLALVLQGTGDVWFDDVQVQVHAGSAAVVPKEGPAPTVAARDVPPDTDFLTDGGFEELIKGQPTGWVAIGKGNPGLELAADTQIKRSGAASATVLNTAADTQQPWNWRQEITAASGHGVPVGRTVELTGWVRTNDATAAMVGVQLLDANGHFIAFHTTQTEKVFSGTVDWTGFALSFPVPVKTARIAVLAMHQGRGQVWFDDFRMVLAAGKSAKPNND